MSLPTDAAARKDIPMARGLLDYFPDALAAVAAVSKAGNDQHNPGEELHWARGKSMDQADCIIRHLIDRDTYDSDGHLHSAKVAWRALALLQQELEDRGAPMSRASKDLQLTDGQEAATVSEPTTAAEPPSEGPPPPSGLSSEPGAGSLLMELEREHIKRMTDKLKEELDRNFYGERDLATEPMPIIDELQKLGPPADGTEGLHHLIEDTRLEGVGGHQVDAQRYTKPYLPEGWGQGNLNSLADQAVDSNRRPRRPNPSVTRRLVALEERLAAVERGDIQTTDILPHETFTERLERSTYIQALVYRIGQLEDRLGGRLKGGQGR
jgi:hypothetical protein